MSIEEPNRSVRYYRTPSVIENACAPRGYQRRRPIQSGFWISIWVSGIACLVLGMDWIITQISVRCGFGFRFWVHIDSTWSQSTPLPSLPMLAPHNCCDAWRESDRRKKSTWEDKAPTEGQFHRRAGLFLGLNLITTSLSQSTYPLFWASQYKCYKAT
jgi:hypothetical protein